MSPITVILILISITLSAIAQIAMKYGVSRPEIQVNLASPFVALSHIATNGYVITGLALYGSSVVFWLFALAKLDVSVAYPFVGIGFLLTMIFGAIVLGEPVGFLRIVGTMLVITGVILVAHS